MRNDVREAQRWIWIWILYGLDDPIYADTGDGPDNKSDYDYGEEEHYSSRCYRVYQSTLHVQIRTQMP